MQKFYDAWQATGKRIVLGEGNPAAPWWIVADGLSKEDEQKGVLFHPDNKTGAMFRGMLEQAHVNPAACFITSLFPFRRDDEDIVQAAAHFHDFLSRYKPKRILALGSLALAGLTAKEGIEDWRGSPFSTKWGGWIVPTLHPMQIQLKFDNKAKSEAGSKYTYGSGRMSWVLDATKCFTWPKLDPPSMTIRTEYDAEEAIQLLHDLVVNPAEPVTFDIETLGNGVIDIIGIGLSPAEAWVFPMRRDAWGSAYLSFDHALRTLLRKHPKLVGQNAAFDQAMLIHHGYQVAPLWFDTRIAQSWVYPDLPGDLHYMVSIYTTHPHYKWLITTKRMYYNGLDCTLTYAVMNTLLQRITKMEGG